MEKYSGNKAGDMSPMVKDYQPGKSEFAGKEFGTANMYMERKERQLNKEAGKLKSQMYKGRYD